VRPLRGLEHRPPLPRGTPLAGTYKTVNRHI
jgi:hypothetical protein